MSVVAHQDDEALGLGGHSCEVRVGGCRNLRCDRCARENGTYLGHQVMAIDATPTSEVGEIRESELRAAASVLGIREVTVLDYPYHGLDRATRRSRRLHTI